MVMMQQASHHLSDVQCLVKGGYQWSKTKVAWMYCKMQWHGDNKYIATTEKPEMQLLTGNHHRYNMTISGWMGLDSTGI